MIMAATMNFRQEILTLHSRVLFCEIYVKSMALPLLPIIAAFIGKGLTREVGGLKISTFCQRSYHRKCQRSGVGGQKKPKTCQRSL